jgi:hypothetical protein
LGAKLWLAEAVVLPVLTNDASGELIRKFIGIVNEFQSPKPRVQPSAQ